MKGWSGGQAAVTSVVPRDPQLVRVWTWCAPFGRYASRAALGRTRYGEAIFGPQSEFSLAGPVAALTARRDRRAAQHQGETVSGVCERRCHDGGGRRAWLVLPGAGRVADGHGRAAQHPGSRLQPAVAGAQRGGCGGGAGLAECGQRCRASASFRCAAGEAQGRRRGDGGIPTPQPPGRRYCQAADGSAAGRNRLQGQSAQRRRREPLQARRGASEARPGDCAGTDHVSRDGGAGDFPHRRHDLARGLRRGSRGSGQDGADAVPGPDVAQRPDDAYQRGADGLWRHAGGDGDSRAASAAPEIRNRPQECRAAAGLDRESDEDRRSRGRRQRGARLRRWRRVHLRQAPHRDRVEPQRRADP